MSTALATLTSNLAATLGMGDNGDELVETLKSTAFRGAQVSNSQMTALMVVANQYGLNPWTKEIYAFPDKGGIVPVVGVDGWSRIINNHPQFDGMEFEANDESCTCIIYRKDRSRPIRVTEFMAECRKPGSNGPWHSHPRRMLRHKAMIQCARLAFGYAGIYDQDEADRIREVDMGAAEVIHDESPAATKTESMRNRIARNRAQPEAPSAKLEDVLKAFEAATTREELKKAAQSVSETLDDADKETANAAYRARAHALKEQSETGETAAPAYTYAQVAERMNKATTIDELAEAADCIRFVTEEGQQTELGNVYHACRTAIERDDGKLPL